MALSVRYVLTRNLPVRPLEIEITEEEFSALRQGLECINHIRDLEEKFTILMDGYFDLELSLLQEALWSLVFGDDDVRKFEQSPLLASRKFMNLLTAARLYLDSLPQHAAAVFHGRPDALARVNSEPSKAYDSALEYRVMEALRNYAQHQGLPVHFWTTGVWSDKEEPRFSHYDVDAYLDVDRFAASKKKKVKLVARELKEKKYGTELKPHLRKYVELLGAVHGTFRSETKDLRQEIVKAFEAATQKYVARQPSGKLIGLCVGAIDCDGKFISGPIYLDSEPMEYLARLEARTKKLPKLSRSVVEY